ncbi:MAG: GFA family protein [Xanthomonadales bacterium]|nr:GFA family protein [Xanthomonadales bacterium]
MSIATANCLCGAVRIEATLPTKWVAHCHCTMCRCAHGAAFVTWAGFEGEQCRIADPDSRLTWFGSSPGAERGFCSRCGSTLLFRSQRWAGELHVVVANFDGPLDRAPQAHVFWDHHVDWVKLDNDGLPRKVIGG